MIMKLNIFHVFTSHSYFLWGYNHRNIPRGSWMGGARVLCLDLAVQSVVRISCKTANPSVHVLGLAPAVPLWELPCVFSGLAPSRGCISMAHPGW